MRHPKITALAAAGAMAIIAIPLTAAGASAATAGPCQAQGYTGRDMATCQAFTAYTQHPGHRSFLILARNARRDVTFPAVQQDVALWARDRARHAPRCVLARDRGWVWTDLFTSPDA